MDRVRTGRVLSRGLSRQGMLEWVAKFHAEYLCTPLIKFSQEVHRVGTTLQSYFIKEETEASRGHSHCCRLTQILSGRDRI